MCFSKTIYISDCAFNVNWNLFSFCSSVNGGCNRLFSHSQIKPSNNSFSSSSLILLFLNNSSISNFSNKLHSHCDFNLLKIEAQTTFKIDFDY